MTLEEKLGEMDTLSDLGIYLKNIRTELERNTMIFARENEGRFTLSPSTMAQYLTRYESGKLKSNSTADMKHFREYLSLIGLEETDIELILTKVKELPSPREKSRTRNHSKRLLDIRYNPLHGKHSRAVADLFERQMVAPIFGADPHTGEDRLADKILGINDSGDSFSLDEICYFAKLLIGIFETNFKGCSFDIKRYENMKRRNETSGAEGNPYFVGSAALGIFDLSEALSAKPISYPPLMQQLRRMDDAIENRLHAFSLEGYTSADLVKRYLVEKREETISEINGVRELYKNYALELGQLSEITQ